MLATTTTTDHRAANSISAVRVSSLVAELVGFLEVRTEACVALWLVQNERLHGALTSGLQEPLAAALDGSPAGSVAGPLGLCVAKGELVVAPDLSQERRWGPLRDLLVSHGFQACWAVPVKSSAGAVVACLGLLHRRPAVPSDGTFDLLSRAARLAALAIEDVAERVGLEFRALHDALTGLPNRALLQDRLLQAIGDARRRRTRAAVGVVDLDGFKLVNDTLGHPRGDDVLRGVASLLRSTLRANDTVARVGGDEFVVVLTDIASPQAAVGAARKLSEALRRPLALPDGSSFTAAASLGVAVWPDDGSDPATLVARADQAMYQAKRSGAGVSRWMHAAGAGEGRC